MCIRDRYWSTNVNIAKYKNLLLQADSVVQKYRRNSDINRGEVMCASLQRSLKKNALRKMLFDNGIPNPSMQRIAKKHNIKFTNIILSVVFLMKNQIAKSNFVPESMSIMKLILKV